MTGPGVVMKAIAGLRPLGSFRPSPHGGVAVGRVAGDVLSAASELMATDPGRFEHVQRLVPVERVVRFEREEVTETLCHALADDGSRVAGKRFYVRCRLRGLGEKLESRAVERAIGSYLWELASRVGTAPSVSFDHPDLVVAIEVVGNTVGYAFHGPAAIHSRLVRPR